MSDPLIVIVDDDLTHLNIVTRALQDKATVMQFISAEALIDSPMLKVAQLIVLDWNLPGINGLEALKIIRQTLLTPVLFLTSFDAESRVVSALGAGADDYLVKPFRGGELNARIQMLLRRHPSTNPASHANSAVGSNENGETRTKLLQAGVLVDQIDSSVHVPGQAPVKLSQKEYALAVLFFQNVGRALSRETIIHNVWGRGENIPSRTLDTHVSRLRTRLNLRPAQGWRLIPVYSFGYRLDTREDHDDFDEDPKPKV
jgi:DNA-binding response OmpR family regulator